MLYEVITATVFLSGSSILTAIRAQVEHASCVADGNLEATVEGTFSPEFQRLRDAIAKMVANLKGQMRDALSKEEEALAAKSQTEAALKHSEEQQQVLDTHRITSYNVCYTKLLRMAVRMEPGRAERNACPRGPRSRRLERMSPAARVR